VNFPDAPERQGREEQRMFFLAFFPVVASDTNLSTSIGLQKYKYIMKYKK
jgi:hypothetical protein